MKNKKVDNIATNGNLSLAPGLPVVQQVHAIEIVRFTSGVSSIHLTSTYAVHSEYLVCFEGLRTVSIEQTISILYSLVPRVGDNTDIFH